MSEFEDDPVVTTEAYVPLPDQSYKAKLADGSIIGSADTEQSTIQIACAYYTAIMIINPKRPYQIGIYNNTGTLQAVIGEGGLMAIKNFKGKQAAPFAKRKASSTSRKASSTKTAGGVKKK